MRCLSAIVATTVMVGTVSSFVPTAFVPRSSGAAVGTTDSSTVLFIESMSKAEAAPTVTDPNVNVQAYLRKRNEIIARDNLVGNALVTGAVRGEIVDQDLFEMMNSAESGFEYDTITCYCDDIKAAKKRLISRRSRYSGLFDKLDFMQSEQPGALPTAEQIKTANVTNWVAVIDKDHFETMDQIYNICFECKGTLMNVAILLTNAIEFDPEKCAEMDAKFAKFSEGFRDESVPMEERLARNPIEHTIVAVGEPDDYPEGTHAYSMIRFGAKGSNILPGNRISRQLAFRFVTDLLVLDASSGRSFCFAENNNATMPEVRLINGMREAGFNHLEELEEIINGAVANYTAACRAYRRGGDLDGIEVYTGVHWWETPEYQSATDEQQAQTARMKKWRERADEKEEIRKIARAWVAREFFRKSMAGKLEGMDEHEFERRVWDRAMEEGERRFRVYSGEIPDENGKYVLGYKAKQQRIEDVMVERARQEMRQLLEEEGENFDDVKTLSEEEAEMDYYDDDDDDDDDYDDDDDDDDDDE